MARIQAVAAIPEKGSVWRPANGRFDLAGLQTAIEEAVCQAWQEEAARKRKGDAMMNEGTERLKPAESAPQQASKATDCAPVGSDGSTCQDLCQEVLGRVLAAVEERALAAYQEALGEASGLAMERDRIRTRVAAAQAELAVATAEADRREEADRVALGEARATAEAALTPYISAGVVTANEAEEQIEEAMREARARLQAQGQEARMRVQALQSEMEELQTRYGEVDSRRASVEARLTKLRALPSIAALERARQLEEARRREAFQGAIRFLATAPWHELSWQRRLTPRLEEVAALAGQDRAVFEALAERLGRELDRVDAAARPGIGWSVVRAIEALEMERLFPSLEAKRAGLVRAARQYHRERQAQPALAEKVVSLASRWGARVAAR